MRAWTAASDNGTPRVCGLAGALGRVCSSRPREPGEIMKLLAIGRPRAGTDTSQIARRARDEMRALWQLYREGVVREMYSPGRPGAVLVLETADRQQAENAVVGLPLAMSGVIDFEVIELLPFGAFEVLFAGQPPSDDPGQGPVSA
jgi:hypothetical protein